MQEQQKEPTPFNNLEETIPSAGPNPADDTKPSEKTGEYLVVPSAPGSLGDKVVPLDEVVAPTMPTKPPEAVGEHGEDDIPTIEKIVDENPKLKVLRWQQK